MAIPISCPSCNVHYQLADRLAGKNVRCKSCNQVFQVGDDKGPPQDGRRVGEGIQTNPGGVVSFRDDQDEVRPAVRPPRSIAAKKRNTVVIVALLGVAMFGLLLLGGIGAAAFWLLQSNTVSPQPVLVAVHDNDHGQEVPRKEKLNDKDLVKAVPQKKNPKGKEKGQFVNLVPEWTTDLAKMTPPDGPISGKMFGADIKFDRVALQATGLHLQNGKDLVHIFLQLKPGVGIANKIYEYSPENRGAGAWPAIHIHVHSADKPKAAAYTSNYAMRLAFGEENAGIVTGKLYLCLPDADKSFIAGSIALKLQ